MKMTKKNELNAAKMLSMTGDAVQNVNYAIKFPYLIALLDSLQENDPKKKSSTIKSKNLEDISASVKKSVVLIKAE